MPRKPSPTKAPKTPPEERHTDLAALRADVIKRCEDEYKAHTGRAWPDPNIYPCTPPKNTVQLRRESAERMRALRELRAALLRVRKVARPGTRLAPSHLLNETPIDAIVAAVEEDRALEKRIDGWNRRHAGHAHLAGLYLINYLSPPLRDDRALSIVSLLVGNWPDRYGSNAALRGGVTAGQVIEAEMEAMRLALLRHPHAPPREDAEPDEGT